MRAARSPATAAAARTAARRGGGPRPRCRWLRAGFLLVHHGAAPHGRADGTSPLSSGQIGVPLLTLSPILTRIFLDRARWRRRHVHRRLVGFQRDQRVVGLDRVAGLDEISMTGTSLKSPMSGTFTSIMSIISTSPGLSCATLWPAAVF